MLSSFADCRKQLEEGNLAVLPTETVYGLAANGLSHSAVKKIFRLKGRPTVNPVILHVQNIQRALEYAEVCVQALKLAKYFWPGPLTLLLKKKEIVPGIVTANLNTVGLRSPSNETFQAMLNCLDFPLAAPSANPSNRTSPTTASQVVDFFGIDCPPVLDDGPANLGIESTILDLTSSTPCVVRPGHISASLIGECLDLEVKTSKKFHDIESPEQISPGSSQLHYAPLTPTLLHSSQESCLNYNAFSNSDLLLLPDATKNQNFKGLACSIDYLSKDGDLKEIAHSIYMKLHEADRAKFSKLHLCLLDEKDELALAINDRITRACGKK